MDERLNKKKIYTPAQAKLKAESYCAYQERAQQEVRDKLYGWGLHMDDVENLIAELISDNFLNEERFALAYASGKFRMKGWGKIKIRQHLRLKKIPEKIIKTALNAIDEAEYSEKINKLLTTKTAGLKKPFNLSTKAKIFNYLSSKGYESDLILKKIKED